MTADMDTQNEIDDGLPGPGAPTPLSALEGIAGLTGRDIKLFVDAGYHTVESIAYTYVLSFSSSSPWYRCTLQICLQFLFRA
ncbi:hypothetical protein BO71DRAFT_128696 [Aspergillus ellipticus CBS 707.79]|uniref:Uncharacterized protein n=1 Tax=Aspergillus ellipticus CBS 707.79 TaxID=1448320 RepID=A0A319DKT9_9EURO|nr:hypothetical protein BO71DRAFT_128696 [Aspergillus ellipticus CBS 707.79]